MCFPSLKPFEWIVIENAKASPLAQSFTLYQIALSKESKESLLEDENYSFCFSANGLDSFSLMKS